MKHLLPLSLLSLSAIMATGCVRMRVEKHPDGTVIFQASSPLWSNAIYKGLNVDSSTKTTTNLLKLTSGGFEPNSDSITASGEALGSLIGAAAKTAAKP